MMSSHRGQRVALIHPEIRTTQPPQHPPYGLLQLAAITDQLGFNVGVYDNNAFRLPIDSMMEELKKEVAVNGPWTIFGITGLTTQYKYIKEYLPFIRRHYPDATIVGGGGFLTAQPREMLHWLPDLDIGVIGEAYRTWPEVLSQVDEETKDWKNVKGLVYREGSKIKLSGMRPLIPEAELDDEVPYPAYEFSPVQTYLMYSAIPYCPELIPRPDYMPRRLDALTSYGCPWQCTFCFHNGCTPACQSKIYGKPVKGKPIRHHSPSYVVKFMTHLRLQYCVNFISFIDENLTADKAWFEAFCEQLEQSGLPDLELDPLHWGMVVHTRTVDGHMLERAKQLGCRYISYGGESCVQKLLDGMKKGQNKIQMAAAIDSTQTAGITPIMSFIIGFPETTIDDVIEDCQFFIDKQITCDPFFLQPYPGSELYAKYKEQIIDQFITDEEKAFIKNPDLGTWSKLPQARVQEAFDAPLPSKSQLVKMLPEIKEKIRDAALERWILVLDDATKLSVNLTKFNDVELAGLRYMLNKWEITRLKKFKQERETLEILQETKHGTSS